MSLHARAHTHTHTHTRTHARTHTHSQLKIPTGARHSFNDISAHHFLFLRMLTVLFQQPHRRLTHARRHNVKLHALVDPASLVASTKTRQVSDDGDDEDWTTDEDDDGGNGDGDGGGGAAGAGASCSAGGSRFSQQTSTGTFLYLKSLILYQCEIEGFFVLWNVYTVNTLLKRCFYCSVYLQSL
jgi:hypothetical protein